jgi:putative transport protein
MDSVAAFLSAQPLFAVFLVIGLGYAVGEVDVRGFSLGVGAVLFVGLGVGMLAPGSAPPALVGSLGLVMFVYCIGIQYGRDFFAGLGSRFGAKANALALLSHLVAAGLCCAASVGLRLAPGYVAGLFSGALTNTPALHAALGAAGNNDPALGYSVAYPVGVIVPILCMHFGFRWLRPEMPAAAASRLHLGEIALRNEDLVGKPLADVNASLPKGVQILVVREGQRNRLPDPALVLAHDDVVGVVGESAEALERACELMGVSANGRITHDRLDLDHFRLVVSQPDVVGVKIADLRPPGVSALSVTHVHRADAVLMPSPDVVLEYGDRVSVIARRDEREAVRAHFGDSIKGTTVVSYVSLGVGMGLGVLLGLLPIPCPGIGTFSLGIAGGPLVVALVLGRFGRTGGWVWTIPLSANLTLRNFGLTVFLAQVGMVSGPQFIRTFSQMGPLLLGLGGAIALGTVAFCMAAGYFLFRLRFDEVLGVTAGVATNPAILAFGNKLAATDRTDLAYATTFPVATITKIVLVQAMLALMH